MWQLFTQRFDQALSFGACWLYMTTSSYEHSNFLSCDLADKDGHILIMRYAFNIYSHLVTSMKATEASPRMGRGA